MWNFTPKKQKHNNRHISQSLLPLKPAERHISAGTHATHQGSAGRWEEHRGERDGCSLAHSLSPHHPASPSQQERDLNQCSKQKEGEWGTGEGRKRRGQEETGAAWVRGSRRSWLLKGVPWNEGSLLSHLVFLAASFLLLKFVDCTFFKYWTTLQLTVTSSKTCIRWHKCLSD